MFCAPEPQALRRVMAHTGRHGGGDGSIFTEGGHPYPSQPLGVKFNMLMALNVWWWTKTLFFYELLSPGPTDRDGTGWPTEQRPRPPRTERPQLQFNPGNASYNTRRTRRIAGHCCRSRNITL